MKTKIFYICFLSFISLSCAQNKTHHRDSQHISISNIKLDSLKKVLHAYVDKGELAGIQTAILKKNKLVHYSSYGYADIENKKPLDSLSIFRIFSMTKPITSVGLMQLYEQGKFKLEDPIHLYIPEFKEMTVYNKDNKIVPAKRQIKIIDLLRHSSGISYGRSPNPSLNTKYTEASLGSSKGLKEFIKRITKLPLLFEPGTDYEYGYSTDICGYLIEVLSGQSLDEYLQKNVLDPLKMKDTHFQLPEHKINHFTTGYRSGENGKLEIAELPTESMFINKPSFIKGGGGLVSTTNDYLNLCRMLLNKGVLFDQQILKPETIDLMTKDHLESVRKHKPRLRILSGETGFGLGFSVAEKEDKSIVYGWGGAVGTYFRIDPKQDLAYLMMIQLSPYKQLNLRETFQKLVNNSIIDTSKKQKIIKPILLDKSMLSGTGLKPVKLKDQPNRDFFQGQLYRGEALSAYMISSSTASKDFENFPIEEFVYLSNGSMNFNTLNTKSYEFEADNFLAIPKGYKGSIKTIGNPQYHLELSIISNKRSDQKEVSKLKQPLLIDKNLISLQKIQLNENDTYKNILYSGIEIIIILEVEKPRTSILDNTQKEQIIHILEGSVYITTKDGIKQVFKKGDFFVLPKNFNGKWESNSSDLFRSIIIKANI